MNELGPEAQALLEAAREGDEPSAGDAARVREKLALRLSVAAAAGSAASVLTTQAAAGGASIAGAGVAGAAAGTGLGTGAAGAATAFSTKVILLAVLAGGTVTAGTIATRWAPDNSRSVGPTQPVSSLPAPRERASSGETERPGPPVASAARPDETLLEEVPPGQSAAATPPKKKQLPTSPETTTPLPPRSAAAPPAPPQRQTKDSVAEEAALLHAAHAALARGDSAAALVRLNAHAARFPQGALAEERRAARVFALCTAGRVSEARSAASAFLAMNPHSPLASQVRRTCAQRPPQDDSVTKTQGGGHP